MKRCESTIRVPTGAGDTSIIQCVDGVGHEDRKRHYASLYGCNPPGQIMWGDGPVPQRESWGETLRQVVADNPWLLPTLATLAALMVGAAFGKSL